MPDHTITPPPPWGTLFTMLTSANRLPTRHHTHGLHLGGQVGHTAKLSKMMLEAAYGREINIKFSGNSSGGHSYSQHANCMLPQNFRHLWCCVTKLHILKWPFILPGTRCTCVMLVLFKLASWYATPVRCLEQYTLQVHQISSGFC